MTLPASIERISTPGTNDVDAKPVSSTQRSPLRWSLPTLVGFRFAFAWFVLRYFPSPLDDIPLVDELTSLYYRGAKALAALVGAHVLHLAQPVSTATTGSGDRMVDWIRLGCQTVLAVLVTVVWSVLDRRRPHYATLHDRLRTYLRYVLAVTMLDYGVGKLFLLQFPAPPNFYLMETYGESSPARLLWTFMGASPSYQFFGGLMETLGGMLLFFRRTSTLGALVLVSVLTNVVLLNFSYDVSVKIYSTTLLLTAVFLVAPSARRLFDFFVLHRDVRAVALGAFATSRRGRRVAMVVKTLFIAGMLVAITYADDSRSKQQEALQASPVAGFYEVEEGSSPIGERRWTIAEITGMHFGVRRDAAPYSRYVIPKYDAAAGKMTLQDVTVPGAPTYVVSVTKIDDGHVAVRGKIGDEDIDARLRRIDPPPSLLRTRGFHWVNEYNFNR